MKKKLLCSLVLAVTLVLNLGSPVLAISDPDYVTIEDVYVFRDVLEDGDQLYFCRYDVSYNTTPSEDPEDTWQMALYNEGIPEATRALNYYDHNIISIYLDPDEALAWEGGYEIRITGMPSVFDPLVEGTNWVKRALAIGDYYEGGSLGDGMIEQAGLLEADLGTLLTINKLNDNGSVYFLAAVPGLNLMVPEIFTATITYPSVNYTEWDTSYEEGLQEHEGARLRGAITGVGSIFGLSEGWSGFFAGGLLFLVLAGIIYVPTRDPKLSLLPAFPILVGAAWLGIGTTWLQIVVIVVLVAAFLFGVYFILGKFA